MRCTELAEPSVSAVKHQPPRLGDRGRYPSYILDMGRTSQVELDAKQLDRLRMLAECTGTPVETLVRTAVDDLL